MKTFSLISRILGMALLAGVLVAPVKSDKLSPVAKKFVGSWKLVSIVGGNPNAGAARGEHPIGIIIYDVNGDMAVQIMPDRVRPKYSPGGPTPDEAKQALSGYVAYFGTFTVDEKEHIVTHHLKGNINPGGIDDEQRRYEFSGDRLTLTPVVKPPAPETHLTWERIK